MFEAEGCQSSSSSSPQPPKCPEKKKGIFSHTNEHVALKEVLKPFGAGMKCLH
jgi:hypothetical protein